MIGHTVGSYKITEKIGEGGMGTVFKGVDVMLDREVAIKMLRPELARQAQLAERFRSEAVTLARLNHPNIATLYSFLRQNDDLFMVMEYVRGETLEQFIREHGAMNCETAVKLCCHALEGIEHAHGIGIIHRDIKPANMMLTERGSVKLMDFGIARVLGTDRMTRAGHLVGTIEYMSPEQVRGGETDARSDMYSLGILLYEMLTGRVPFTGPSEYELMRSQVEDPPPPPREFAPQTPVEIEQAIMRALAKEKEDRFQTASEFRLALLAGNTTPSRTNVSTLSPRHVVKDQTFEPITHSQQVKETRLAPALASPQGAVGQTKATRLVTQDESQPRQTATPQPVQFVADSSSAQSSLTYQPSFFSKLNWKHYSAAAAVLLVLIVAVFGIILSILSGTVGKPAVTDSKAKPNVAPVNENPATSTTARPSSASSEQLISSPADNSGRSDKGSQSSDPFASTSRRESAKARNRSATSTKQEPAKTAQRRESPPPSQAKSTPPSKSAVPAPPPTSSKAEGEKNTNDNKKKGGFLQKLKKIVPH